MMAEAAIAAMARALPKIALDPSDREARSDALFGAWLCGLCLGAVGMSLHHKLCHVLGGAFDLPHAETHTVILPHALAYNASAAPEAMARIAHALGVADAPEGMFEFAAGLRAPLSLSDLGMPEDGIRSAARDATQDAYWNPRPVDQAGVSDLLTRAYRGQRPSEANSFTLAGLPA